MIGPPRWVDSYISIPFEHAGRTHAGCDCWGLVRLVLQEQASLKIEEYAGMSGLTVLRTALAIRRAMSSETWRPTTAVEPFVCVPMLAGEVVGKKPVLLEMHVGIIVGGFWVLHTEEASGAVCSRLHDDDIRGRLRRPFRKHRDLP